MRILVVGPAPGRDGPSAAPVSGAGSVLRDLGCEVLASPLWGELDARSLARSPVDLIVIDTGDSPEVGAYELLRLRKVAALAETPAVLGVSAGSLQRIDHAAGFADFVVTPAAPQELYARVRQLDWRKSAFSAEEIIKVDELVIDLPAHEARLGGRPVPLTRQEFALLAFLAKNRGRAFGRDKLLRGVWGVGHYGGSRTIDVHVRRLRAKLGRVGDRIETLRGVGYRMRGEP